MPQKNRQRTGWLAAAGLFMLLAILVAARATLVDRSVGTYIACPGCFHIDVALADLVMFAALASLLLLASCTRTGALSRIPLLVCGLVFLIFTADMVVFALYNSRLLMADVVLFSSEGTAIWDQFSSGLGGPLAAAVVVAALAGLFVVLWWMPLVRTRAFRLVMLLLLMLSLAVTAVFKPAPYVNDWAVESVFSANLSTPLRHRYSDDAAAAALNREMPESLWGGVGEAPAQGRNVILLLLESWSSWHSALFGGFESWTPNLDTGARRGLRFENFHSIGFSTDKGLVGILAGQQLWVPFLHWFETPPFHSMWGLADTLPAVFNRAGYHTAFLTSGPLDLYQKGEWLSDIGFAEVEGNEHPFYADQPRFAFGSASDRALYERALEWIDASSQPWLLVLETVSTHQPYKDPESGRRSLELAMKYADRTFGTLLSELDDTQFFDHGILVVVSDHRSMTPMSKLELDRWGQAAHSLVPAFAIGGEFAPGTMDDAVYSQSDLTPSFEWWLAGNVALGPLEAVMFDPAFEAGQCAFHERNDRRGLIEVTCDEGRGQVILDGDHTRFVGTSGLTPAREQQVLDVIARQRLEAWQRHLATNPE